VTREGDRILKKGLRKHFNSSDLWVRGSQDLGRTRIWTGESALLGMKKRALHLKKGKKPKGRGCRSDKGGNFVKSSSGPTWKQLSKGKEVLAQKRRDKRHQQKGEGGKMLEDFSFMRIGWVSASKEKKGGTLRRAQRKNGLVGCHLTWPIRYSLRRSLFYGGFRGGKGGYENKVH